MDELKFHKRAENLICGWSMMHGHSFTEQELNSLVDLIGDDSKLQAKRIFKNGVKVGKQLGKMYGNKKMDEAGK